MAKDKDSIKEDYNFEQHDDNAVNRVPDDQKRSTLSVALVAAGYCICMSGLFTGAAMGAGMSLKGAIIAALVGNLILSLYAGFLGQAGATEGVSTSMLARFSFGREGSKIIGLILALVMGGWYSYQVAFFGQTIEAMFPNFWLTSANVAALWGGLLMLSSAYFGYRGLNIVSDIAVPAVIITATIGVIASVNHMGGWAALLAVVPSTTITLSAGIVMVVGSFAGGASAQADIMRYAKSPKAAWIATLIGYVIANAFIILAGFICTLATGNGNLPAAMLALGLGFPALIVLIAAQWTTNDNNLYTCSLGLRNMLHFRKSRITFVVGVVATLCGAAGISTYFATWLSILGVAIPPMAGIIIADYYFINRGKYKYDPGTKICKWNLIAFGSWIVACIVGFLVTWGIPSITSLVVGFALYCIFSKIFEKNNIGKVGEYIEPEIEHVDGVTSAES